MQFSIHKKDSKTAPVFRSLEDPLRGLGMSLVELDIFHAKRKGPRSSVSVKAIVFLLEGITGIEDCAKAHRLIMPRLELAFPESDISLEVSSPGIDRLIKDGEEFAHYIGKHLRCYIVDDSDWVLGKLIAADGEKIVLETEKGEIVLPYEKIAKARLGGA